MSVVYWKMVRSGSAGNCMCIHHKIPTELTNEVFKMESFHTFSSLSLENNSCPALDLNELV